MKTAKRSLAIILCFCTLMSLATLFVSAAKDGNIPSLTPSKITCDRYTTYTMADAAMRWQTPNVSVDGYTCTALQGMNTGTNYCYVSKITSSEAVAAIVRINMNTGERFNMNYYPGLTATTPVGCNTIGHANELMVCGTKENGVTVNYLFAATIITGRALSRLKIDNDGLYFTGYFDLVTTGGTSVNCGSMRHIKTEGGYFYFLIKRSATFYYCKIPVDATGGPESNPTKITIYKLFNADMHNAVFATSSSSYGTYDNMESWTNQGFGYNHNEKVLYIPLWDKINNSSRSVIITFNIADFVTDERLASTAETSATVFPTVTSFLFEDTSEEVFEIESCSFRTGQGTDGDLKLYFIMNTSSISKEGVYSCSYTSGSGDFTPIVDDSSIVWTTKYDANGGSGSMSATKHIRGIATRLRINTFTRDGYSFAGWYLSRSSDGKWLYFEADGSARWHTKGEQPMGAYLALYEDRRRVSALSGVDGDTVTCHAQWTPDSTGTKAFYVQYDGNGGTGTMADTKVVYGTDTYTTKNAFVRDGYVFSGWIAHRRSKNQWSYKNVNDLSGSWINVGEDTTDNLLRAYLNGCSLASTSSIDTDIVTFYAAWSRVASAAYPVELKKGDGFNIGGTVESDAGIYTVRVTLSGADGTIATYTENPYAYSFDLSAANQSIAFDALDVGEYNYKVELGTISGSAPTMHTLIDTAFTVVAPGLVLKDKVLEEGGYQLTEKYFSGFSLGAQSADLKELFKYEVTIYDSQGNAVADNVRIGTGFTITCADESCTAVLISDLNGDAIVSAADCISISTAIKGERPLADAAFVAADLDGDRALTTTDCIALEKIVMGQS
ncbi:MAG: InlB B-repeat-containing protein [Clostridia bacterium]|nr:InlB B-repeat-containing protein [Clostridia bacterium]